MSQNKKMRRNPYGTWWLWVLITCVVSFCILMKLTDYSSAIKTLRYSEFIQLVEADKVASVKIESSHVAGSLRDGKLFEATVPHPFPDWDVLKSHNVTIGIAHPISVMWYMLLILLLVALPVLAWFLFRQSRGANSNNGGGVFTMSKSRARMYLPSQIKTRFNSVAGAAEAKEDLADVVDFLQNPEKYHRLGAKIPRGVLLVGAPGNGKTLLAKAVAGEASCRFFSVSGSDFIEVFVGVGAARVRDLFEQARRHAPSIIFIDEIDAVGRTRGSGTGGGHDEREQTLNQLLTEMDGFSEDERTVVVLAATNRAEVLDPALLRAGRFDRHVTVPYPDLVSREQILHVHAKNVKLDPEVNLNKLACGTPGFTGADLENLINEAAIHASKKNQDTVKIADFEEARDRMLIGRQSKTILLSEQERRLIAYHEAGHAIVGLMLPEVTDPLHKVTIIPRGGSLGVTHSLPERDKHSITKEEILARITVMLGGRAAEELVLDSVTTGASNDFEKASEKARAMVCRYGMSDVVGTVNYDATSHGFKYSQHTARLIDEEVMRIVNICHERALSILRTEREKLDTLASGLLEKETLSAQEVYDLLHITPRISHDLR